MPATKDAVRRKDATGSKARDVESERRAGTLILTLARPDRRNSLSEAMLAALHGAIEKIKEDFAHLQASPPAAPAAQAAGA